MAKKSKAEGNGGPEREPRWDIIPLPPNEFKKATLWSRIPTIVPCANRNCRHGRDAEGRAVPDVCDEERVLCDGCFAELLAEVRNRAATNEKLRDAVQKASGGANGFTFYQSVD